MTIPTLVANYKEKVLVTQVQKTYNTIAQALELYKAHNEVSDLTYLFDTLQTSAETRDEFVKYLNNAKTCSNRDANCYPLYTVKKTRPLADNDGKVQIINNDTYERIILPSGALIGIYQYPDCLEEHDGGGWQYDEDGNRIEGTEHGWTRDYCADIMFDANGKLPPNQAGRDYFVIGIDEQGKIQYHRSSDCGDLQSVLATGKLNQTVNY